MQGPDKLLLSLAEASAKADPPPPGLWRGKTEFGLQTRAQNMWRPGQPPGLCVCKSTIFWRAAEKSGILV